MTVSQPRARLVLTFLLLALLLPLAMGCDSPDPEVDDDRDMESGVELIGDEGHDWPLYGRNAEGQHYSPMRQIHRDNVSTLGVAWETAIPSASGIVSEPIVSNGVVYVTGNLDQVFAVDAKSGAFLWTFDPMVRLDANTSSSMAARTNRGVALAKGRIFVGTGDCRLVAADAKSGKKLWEAAVCDPNWGDGTGIAGAPRAGGGLVYMGYMGSEAGVRGSVAAFDEETGKEVWRFWTVPGDPAKGGFETAALEMASKTWGEGWHSRGGGVVWDAITYDGQTGLLFFGTGGSTPYNAMVRDPSGGDNLFLNSIIAVRADTGEYVWHYQTVPHDSWDYDATMHIMVADLDIDGEKRRVVMQAPKNGFLYTLDALTGKLYQAEPIATISWASHVDLETGRPVEIPGARYHDRKDKVLVWPSVTGAHNWYAMGFDPRSSLLYIPVTDMPSFYSQGEGGYGKYGIYGTAYDETGIPDDAGRLVAWDPAAGEPRWTTYRERADNGGVLVTAGDLVFQGDTDGQFSAFDARDGSVLWNVSTGSSIQAAPVTYQNGEDQIILAAMGRGGVVGSLSAERISSTRSRGPAKLIAFKLSGDPLRVAEPPEFLPPPKPPSQNASEKQVAKGAKLYAVICSNCHGYYVRGSETRNLDGGIPDLRYMPESVHAEFRAVVLAGTRSKLGMPAFADFFTVEEADAIHAYIIDQAWKKYRGETAR